MATITDLSELTTPATGDKAVIVDTSDTTQAVTGSTKFVTLANLLGTGAVDTTMAAISDGDTTPSITANNRLETANTGATNITTFDDGSEGDLIYLVVKDANTTLVDGSGLELAGRENYTAQNGDSFIFVSDGTNWHEVGRRVFNLANGADITFSASGNDYTAVLSNTGVTAASYTNASVTVDAKGRITAASSGSGFDNQVPLSIDLDTPGTTGSVVATFTADAAATAAIIEAYRGGTLHVQIDEYGALKLTGVKNYSDIGGDLHVVGDASTHYLIDTTTPTSNTGFAEIYAQYRLSSGDVSNRNLNGLNVIAIIPNSSTGTITGTGALQGGRLVAQYDKSSGTTGGAKGFTLLAGASRAGGTVTTTRVLEAQVFSTGTVTTGTGLYILAPTTPANVTTAIGVDIEAQDIAIRTASGSVILGSLPTSDPVNAGELWNDAGTLKVSAG